MLGMAGRAARAKRRVPLFGFGSKSAFSASQLKEIERVLTVTTERDRSWPGELQAARFLWSVGTEQGTGDPPARSNEFPDPCPIDSKK
jgi:hypothetical protein